jgi:hypothetical protein
MKGKATNEQLAKVLEYTLSEHQKTIEKSEKERLKFLNEFKIEIQNLEKISLKPDLTHFKQLNIELEKNCEQGSSKLKEALKNTYFSPLVLGIVFTVFLSGVGLLIYSFRNIEKANEIEQRQINYFSKFLNDNPKSNESFKSWKEKGRK